jgi:hypothetical protein
LTGHQWEFGDKADELPTFLAHALALSAVHGPGPWPDHGFPLPDDVTGALRRTVTPASLDGPRALHFGIARDPSTVEAICDRVERLFSAAPDPLTVRLLHDYLTTCSPLDLADDLGTEIERRKLPANRLRTLGRHLAEHGIHRAPVKVGLVLLGLAGDSRDRELLLLLGTLDELTLYAGIALHRSQPDRDAAVFQLARRVAGWGRIHTVRLLRDTGDPEIRAWMLREGYRNTVMNEYLAHIAATTGDLHGALTANQVDDALVDGAGDILAALADSEGGPAPGLSVYPQAVPVLARYARLLSSRSPTLGRLRSLLSLVAYLRRAPSAFPGWAADGQRLTARYEALLAEPHWGRVVLTHLSDPTRPDFSAALWPADRLELRPITQVLAHLETSPPLHSFAWFWALRHCDPDQAERVAALAEPLLPSVPSQATAVLEPLVVALKRFPGIGWPILRAGLAGSDAQVSRAARATLAAWPRRALPAEAVAHRHEAVPNVHGTRPATVSPAGPDVSGPATESKP